MKKVLEYIIRARDKTSAGIDSAVKRIGFLKSVGMVAFGVLKIAALAAFAAVATAAVAMAKAVKVAFKFETLRVQFSMLIKDTNDLKRHMQDLKELGDTPPFGLEVMAATSRDMMSMSGGVLGYRDSLIMVGDAAAKTGQDMKALGHEVGKAYAMIRDGEPLSRALRPLMNMGVITPGVVRSLIDMQEAGASSVEIWEKFTEALREHEGAMEKTEETGEGLIDAIDTQWTNIVRTFGDAVKELAEDHLQAILDKMNELQESGAVLRWAENAKKAFDTVIEWAIKAKNAIVGLYKLSGMSDLISGIKGVASAARTLAGGGSAWEAAEAYLKEMVKGGYYSQKINKAMGDPLGVQLKLDAEAAEKQRKEAAKAEERRQQMADKKARQEAETQEERNNTLDALMEADEKRAYELDIAMRRKLDLESELAWIQKQILEKKKKEAVLAGRMERLLGERANLEQLGIAEWIKQQQGNRRQNEQRQDDDQKARKRAEQLEGKQGRGIRISRRDREWLEDFRRAQGVAGGAGHDRLKGVRDRIKALQDKQEELAAKQLEIQEGIKAEVSKLNKNLEKNLEVQ